MTDPRRPRLVSVLLLAGGGCALAAGLFLTFGLGVALIVMGVLLVAAEWLVPSRHEREPVRGGRIVR